MLRWEARGKESLILASDPYTQPLTPGRDSFLKGDEDGHNEDSTALLIKHTRQLAKKEFSWSRPPPAPCDVSLMESRVPASPRIQMHPSYHYTLVPGRPFPTTYTALTKRNSSDTWPCPPKRITPAFFEPLPPCLLFFIREARKGSAPDKSARTRNSRRTDLDSTSILP